MESYTLLTGMNSLGPYSSTIQTNILRLILRYVHIPLLYIVSVIHLIITDSALALYYFIGNSFTSKSVLHLDYIIVFKTSHSFGKCKGEYNVNV